MLKLKKTISSILALLLSTTNQPGTFFASPNTNLTSTKISKAIKNAVFITDMRTAILQAQKLGTPSAEISKLIIKNIEQKTTSLFYSTVFGHGAIQLGIYEKDKEFFCQIILSKLINKKYKSASDAILVAAVLLSYPESLTPSLKQAIALKKIMGSLECKATKEAAPSFNKYCVILEAMIKSGIQQERC